MQTPLTGRLRIVAEGQADTVSFRSAARCIKSSEAKGVLAAHAMGKLSASSNIGSVLKESQPGAGAKTGGFILFPPLHVTEIACSQSRGSGNTPLWT